MPMPKADHQFDLPQFSPNLTNLLLACKAQHQSRFAIDQIGILKGGEICATDGRQLVMLDINHDFEKKSLWVLTRDGYFVKTGVGNFPNGRGIIPEDDKLETVYTGDIGDRRRIWIALAKINRADTVVNGVWFVAMMEKWAKCHADEIKVRCGKKPGQVIVVTAKISVQGGVFGDGSALSFTGGELTYVQMPIQE